MKKMFFWGVRVVYILMGLWVGIEACLMYEESIGWSIALAILTALLMWSVLENVLTDTPRKIIGMILIPIFHHWIAAVVEYMWAIFKLIIHTIVRLWKFQITKTIFFIILVILGVNLGYWIYKKVVK